MKTACFLLILSTSILTAANSKKESPKNTSEIKMELESLQKKMALVRLKAQKSKEVQVAFSKLQDAFRNYYKILHSEMIEIDPKVKPLIQRQKELRSQLYNSSSKQNK